MHAHKSSNWIYVSFKPWLKTVQKLKSIVGPMKLHHNSEFAKSDDVKTELLKCRICICCLPDKHSWAQLVTGRPDTVHDNTFLCSDRMKTFEGKCNPDKKKNASRAPSHQRHWKLRLCFPLSMNTWHESCYIQAKTMAILFRTRQGNKNVGMVGDLCATLNRVRLKSTSLMANSNLDHPQLALSTIY